MSGVTIIIRQGIFRPFSGCLLAEDGAREGVGAVALAASVLPCRAPPNPQMPDRTPAPTPNPGPQAGRPTAILLRQ
ncbi:hypothetical protein [Boudabousia tangfeifanii]|uniref:hypothetical protein n=1 Tax=Boudabousia tangfeifanii TaxID=1912795 RepID=UPI0012ED346F|nr:hypothetical protein [Boudabousia tangfeifanii]